MKMSEGLYRCLCGNLIKQKVGRIEGKGRKGVGVDMVKCKCGMLVSQKTKIQIEIKLEKGERV